MAALLYYEYANMAERSVASLNAFYYCSNRKQM